MFYAVKITIDGTWLKYFKNTAFVPNGDGWPGKTKDYNSTYQYPSGNIDSEIDYFLEIAKQLITFKIFTST